MSNTTSTGNAMPTAQELQEAKTALATAQNNPQTLPGHHSALGTIFSFLLKLLPAVEVLLGIAPAAPPEQLKAPPVSTGTAAANENSSTPLS